MVFLFPHVVLSRSTANTGTEKPVAESDGGVRHDLNLFCGWPRKKRGDVGMVSGMPPIMMLRKTDTPGHLSSYLSFLNPFLPPEPSSGAV